MQRNENKEGGKSRKPNKQWVISVVVRTPTWIVVLAWSQQQCYLPTCVRNLPDPLKKQKIKVKEKDEDLLVDRCETHGPHTSSRHHQGNCFFVFWLRWKKKNETKSCRKFFVADVGFVDKLLKQWNEKKKNIRESFLTYVGSCLSIDKISLDKGGDTSMLTMLLRKNG